MAKRTWNLDEDLAVKSDLKNQFSGAHEVVIVEAVSGYYDSGAEYVDLVVETPNNLNDKGEPKRYNIDRMTITSGDANGNAETFQMGLFQSIFFILGAKPTIKKKNAMVWKDGNKVEEKMDQYVEILGKKIGAILIMKQKYRNVPINGYTKEVIDSAQARGNPEAVWIPQYFKEDGTPAEPKNHFEIRRFYCVEPGANYRKTYSEIKKNEPAEIIDKLEANLPSQEATVMSDAELNDYIEKRMRKQLGSEFDKERFQPYGDAVPYSDDLF